MDMYSVFKTIFSPVFSFLFNIALSIICTVIFSFLLFAIMFFVIYKVNIFKISIVYLEQLKVKFKPYDFFRWLLYDFLTRKERKGVFKEFGFSIFCGRQGAGKTISIIDYLNNIHEKYPRALIITNFKYVHSFKVMSDWRDLIEIRNDTDGVIFAIDEIHSEYSSDAWKDFPETLLSEISQQRKQRVKIVASSQVYSRVVKQIREQCFSVIVCSTFFNRLTRTKEYDGAEYSTSDTPYQVKKKCKCLKTHYYVQSNELRNCYDTYEKIERMQKVKFLPRSERH